MSFRQWSDAYKNAVVVVSAISGVAVSLLVAMGFFAWFGAFAKLPEHDRRMDTRISADEQALVIHEQRDESSLAEVYRWHHVDSAAQNTIITLLQSLLGHRRLRGLASGPSGARLQSELPSFRSPYKAATRAEE